MRRVHNQKNIQLSTKDSTVKKVARGQSILYRFNKNRGLRYLFDFTVFTTAVVLPFTVQAGFFESLVGTSVEAADTTTAETVFTDSIIDTQVLTSSVNPNPNSNNAHGEDILVQDGTLISPNI